MKLNIKAFAITSGLFAGIGLFLITWWIMAFSGATEETFLIGRIYIGYDISPLGSLIGLIWGLVDGMIGGALFAWLYNMISSKKQAA